MPVIFNETSLKEKLLPIYTLFKFTKIKAYIYDLIFGSQVQGFPKWLIHRSRWNHPEGWINPRQLKWSR